jgi:membrane associated rhomboid family serine protease
MFYFFYYIPLGIDVRLRRATRATWGIVAACVVSFVVSRVAPGLFWKLYDAVVFVPADPSLSSLVLNAYVHGGWIHLISNLVSLAVFAPALEDRLGAPRFLLLYHACNVAANLVQAALATHVFPHTAGYGIVGASGAIAGLMGLVLVRFWFARLRLAYWAFMPLQAYTRAGISRVPLVLAVVLWFLMQLGIGLTQVEGAPAEIAVGSHVGGLLVGVLIGLLSRLAHQARDEQHFDRGMRYVERAEWFAAHGQFLDYVGRRPEDPEGHLQLARTQQLTERLDAAAESYHRACALYVEARRFDRVEMVYREAQRARVGIVLEAGAQLHLARLFERTMKPLLAQQAYADYAARYPDLDAAPCALYRAATLAESIGETWRAHPFYRRLVETYPGSIEAELVDPPVRQRAGSERAPA